MNWLDSPSVGGAPGVRLAPDIGVLILVPELEAQVIHHIPGVLDDVGVFAHEPDHGVAAQVLELGNVIGVGGGSEAAQNALLRQEEGAGADGEQCALAGGVVLLELRIGRDEAKRLCLVLEDLVDIAAEDDEDIKVVEALVGLLPGALGSNDDALLGQDLGLASRDGNLESLGSCFTTKTWSVLLHFEDDVVRCVRQHQGTRQLSVELRARIRAQKPATAQPGKVRGLQQRRVSGKLTGILGIMEGRGQDLERTGKVQEVELGMQGKEHINWLVCHCGRLTGHLWQLDMMWLRGRRWPDVRAQAGGMMSRSSRCQCEKKAGAEAGAQAREACGEVEGGGGG